jgi:glycerol-3-phosphate dehydrogenase (NAD(P)+)
VECTAVHEEGLVARRIAVLGATSWGLGLALVLARAGRAPVLLVRDEDEARTLATRRTHARLHGASLPEAVLVRTPDGADLSAVCALVFAVPAQRLRENARRLAPLLPAETVLVSASKGLEQASGLRMTAVLREELAGHPVAALSGPNLVPELVSSLPAAAVLACTDPSLAAQLQGLLATPQLRLYTSTDLIGVELGGALKNVIALAAGMSDGLGCGDNAKAALVTRGLAEIVRLGVALGAEPLTFAGLSGLGDLIATCASPLSRNNRAGRLLAAGRSRAEVEAEIGEVVEGIASTAAARALAHRHAVSMPITEQLYRVLHEGLEPRVAADTLLLRDLTAEPPV